MIEICMEIHNQQPAVDTSPQHAANLDEDICVHIFTTSAVMLGVCMTVVGVLHVVTVLRNVDTLGDDLLSIDSMFYLGSCLSAYWALRTRRAKRNRILERLADWLFLIGLVISTVATGFITWAITGT
jgi:Flp pilus assembly protein TadB